MVMPSPGRDHALDHVVVLMFENRSFDNLLGRLYQPGEVPSFEGVIGRELSNPIPLWATEEGGPNAVPYGVASRLDLPSPDSGEDYQHINTQLFGIIDPVSNRGKPAAQMSAPYNAPPDSRLTPPMDGFVADYISTLQAELGRMPRYEEYAQIMTGYTAEQMPVVSALARGFTTFDHWFCDVPSQTFPNRSFFHAATSGGHLEDANPADAFPLLNSAETIFERLEAHGLSWRVYCDPPSRISVTGVIHARRLLERFATNFFTTDQFAEDAAAGQLPAYSFIEPNLLYGHNDMHPGADASYPDVPFDPPSSMIAGEGLLARIYDQVRSAASPRGSNAWNTLLLVTFDEAGGTYDHVPPPPVPPPDPAAPAGQFGFRFDRAGVRVPAFAISAWAPERTVVTGDYRHTSVIRTLRDRWELGPPLTSRDESAPSLAPALGLDTPRDPASWPKVLPRPVPPFDPAALSLRARLRGLPRVALFGLQELGRTVGIKTPDFKQDENITRAEAIEAATDLFGHLFPNLDDPRQ
jgi:phospholipase C